MKIFKRKIYNNLLSWKKKSSGSTALLIEGARRIGKSTIVKEFAKREYSSHILIDFTSAPNGIKELFEDTSDLNFLFLSLQTAFHTKLTPRKSVIIFDEVQFCPAARQAIKHLVEDGRYDYIETGSLISIRKNVKDILIPSEERKIRMRPLDFEEFLWAINEPEVYGLVKEFYEEGHPLGQAANRKLSRLFRLYMLVGGMPQSVQSFLSTNDFESTDRVKRDILSLYLSDFMKIDTTGTASQIFEAVPSQLTSRASRYILSGIVGKKTQAPLLSLISEMRESQTILVSYHANDPGAGMSAHKDLSRFKLFLCDTGLLTTLMFKDRDFTENDLYQKLLADRLSANLGFLYENALAQILDSSGHELFYYTWQNKTSRHNYEIDFLISRNNKICPIEVKSSGYRQHTSLDLFSEKFSDRISHRYLVYTKDYAREGSLIYLPFYMAPFL